MLLRRITQDIYDTKFKKEKELQVDILIRKEDHTNADKEFHITASTVLNLAKRATEIVKRSEPEEKRQFMSYLLQNCLLNGKNLEFTLRNPFNLIAKYSNYPTLQGLRDAFRTINWAIIKRDLQPIASLGFNSF